MKETRETLLDDLRGQLRFEELLADLTARFVNLPPEEVGSAIDGAQKLLCDALEIDRSSLWQPSERDSDELFLTHIHQSEFGNRLVPLPQLNLPEWQGAGQHGPETLPSYMRIDARRACPWSAEKVRRGEAVVIDRLEDLPPEAAPDLKFLGSVGTRSTVLLPLIAGGRWCGLLTFASLQRERAWPERIVSHFRLVAQVFADALARKKADGALSDRLRFEQMASGISARLMAAPIEGVDREIQAGLEHILGFFEVERCALLEFQEDRGLARITHAAFGEDEDPISGDINLVELFPWCYERLLRGDPIDVSGVGDYPEDARTDRRSHVAMGIKSALNIPLALGGTVSRSIVLNTTRRNQTWQGEYIPRLRLLGEIFSSAVERNRAAESLRESEERLRESEELSRATFEQAAVGIAHVGTDGRWLRVNDKLCAIVGYPREELMRSTFQDITHPDDLEADLEFVRQVLSGEIKTYSMEKRYFRKDRSLVWVNLTVSLVRTASGEPNHFISVVEDITGRKRDEAELLQMQMQLWHAARVAQTGALTASLAHELNQPLAGILSTAQAGLRFMAGGTLDPELIRELLTNIVQDTKRAAGVINGLRAMLRHRETQREPIDLADAIREVFDLLHSEMVTRQVEHDLRMEPDVRSVANRGQIQQVVLNLAMNALEAMQDWPGDPRRLELALARSGAGEVLVSLRDSGPGIAEDQREKLFDAFWTTKERGMGLGLRISRSIIESHGGRLWCENNPDGGATFSFTLPVLAGPAAPGPGGGPAPDSRG